MSPRDTFPERALPDLSGESRPLASLWSTGPALILIGHSGCDTTRFALPFVDRVHRRCSPGTSVAAVLQDDPGDARALAERLGLGLPVLLEPSPYTLSAAVGLTTVPTLFHVEAGGRIEGVLEAFRRDELAEIARGLGVAGPLFTPEDHAPALRPG